MAWDESGTKREVESLKKRYPKRGIDATIPAGIREVLRDREQEQEMSTGEKNRYAKGGITKMAKGGMPRNVPFDPDSPSGRTSMKGIALPSGGRYINPTGASTSVKVPPAELIKVPPAELIKAPPEPNIQTPPPMREPPGGYAKGGSVKGSGCEQRGLRKCKVI